MIRPGLFRKTVNDNPFWDRLFENLACGIPPLGTYTSPLALQKASDHSVITSFLLDSDDIRNNTFSQYADDSEYFIDPNAKMTKTNLVYVYVRNKMIQYNLMPITAKKLLADVHLGLVFKVFTHQALSASISSNIEMDEIVFDEGTYSITL